MTAGREIAENKEQTSNLMEQYGITVAYQAVYLYDGCKYGNLEDALSYAKLVAARANPAGRKRSTAA